MDEAKLGSRVVIKAISIEGIVIGIWYSLYGQPRYNIRYYDKSAQQVNCWLSKEEIEVVKRASE